MAPAKVRSAGGPCTTLKQRVRQLTAENRTLEERLQAARSNNRFADRRIAQLEAELATPRGPQDRHVTSGADPGDVIGPADLPQFLSQALRMPGC